MGDKKLQTSLMSLEENTADVIVKKAIELYAKELREI